MTIVEQIVREAEALPPKDRHELLKYARTMRAGRNGKASSAASTRKASAKSKKTSRGAKGRWELENEAKREKSSKAEVSAAVRGIAGMWADRTDLPKDPVLAVKALRARMRLRGRNA